MALTADPGSSGSRCLASLTDPAPIHGTMPAAAHWGANCRTASSEKPLKTSGASIGFKNCAKLSTDPGILEPTPGAAVLPAAFVIAGLLAEASSVGDLSSALISSISAIGVTPAIGSFENSPIRNARAPASLPSK